MLLTLADMSVIQAEVEVDETNIPSVQIGQLAKITIDAIPDQIVQRPRHRDRQQPDPGDDRRRRRGRTQATNFKVVVVLDEKVPDVRPGFTCTADITTATRKNVSSVPIPAVAVRELVYDANGQIVREPRTDKRRRTPSVGRRPRPRSSSPARRARKPRACSSCASGRAEFVPIKMGIAGDKYFEVLSGSRPAIRSSPGRTTRSAAWPTAIR